METNKSMRNRKILFMLSVPVICIMITFYTVGFRWSQPITIRLGKHVDARGTLPFTAANFAFSDLIWQSLDRLLPRLPVLKTVTASNGSQAEISTLAKVTQPVPKVRLPPATENFLKLSTDEFCRRDFPAHYETGKPCSFRTEVDFRIILIVFNRSASLRKSTQTLHDLDTLGHRVVVDIWIDRSTAGVIDEQTYETAMEFSRNWTKGHACVHNQTSNAFITGQWVDSWRPAEHDNELGLIVEDDVTISPLAYRWLRAVHNQYGTWSNISGYTLQMENVNFFAGGHRKMSGPSTDNVFMYKVLGTWGFAPHPRSWRKFQDWYHATRVPGSTLKPYVPGIMPTDWYKMFEGQGRQETMWEMWHIYFTYISNEWCVYCNLIKYMVRLDICLSTNRLEAGLHYGDGDARDDTRHLMRVWNDKYLNFPHKPVMYSYAGINENA